MAIEPREYRFQIDAYTPATMPLDKLIEYLNEVVEILGEPNSIHLLRVTSGSTCPIFQIDHEAEPKVYARLKEIESEDAPPKVMEAVARLNHKLRMDNATGLIVSPAGDNLIVFPGRQQETLEYGPFAQPGTLDGVPILVGGSRSEVSIHLQGRGGEKYNCLTNRAIAAEIARHLFVKLIRVVGIGRWIRRSEGWEMRSFRISTFTPLAQVSDLSLQESIQALRSIPAAWKETEDPIGELIRLRHGDENHEN